MSSSMSGYSSICSPIVGFPLHNRADPWLQPALHTNTPLGKAQSWCTCRTVPSLGAHAHYLFLFTISVAEIVSSRPRHVWEDRTEGRQDPIFRQVEPGERNLGVRDNLHVQTIRNLYSSMREKDHCLKRHTRNFMETTEPFPEDMQMKVSRIWPAEYQNLSESTWVTETACLMRSKLNYV